MKRIIHAVHITARREKVFEALTTEGGLSSWWTTRVSVDARVGGVVDFTFLEGFNPDMEITALDSPAVVAWTCVGGHEPWANNTFRFAIEKRVGDAMLMFSQDYAQELDDETYGNYNFNWGYYLNSLKLFCESGAGTPFQA